MSKETQNDIQESISRQMLDFNRTLKEISDSYFHLVGDRYYTDISRDKYMIYDMCDMLIALQAVLSEAKSQQIYPDYMVEKLSRMKSYVDTTYNYFKEKCDE